MVVDEMLALDRLEELKREVARRPFTGVPETPRGEGFFARLFSRRVAQAPVATKAGRIVHA